MRQLDPGAHVTYALISTRTYAAPVKWGRLLLERKVLLYRTLTPSFLAAFFLQVLNSDWHLPKSEVFSSRPRDYFQLIF